MNSLTFSIPRHIRCCLDWCGRLARASARAIAGLLNRMAIGGSYSDVEFFTQRRFGSTSSVDLQRPGRGRFPVGDDPVLVPRREATTP